MVTTPYDELTIDQVIRAIERGEQDHQTANTHWVGDQEYYHLFDERYRDTAGLCLTEIRKYGFLAVKVEGKSMFGSKVWSIYVARNPAAGPDTLLVAKAAMDNARTNVKAVHEKIRTTHGNIDPYDPKNAAIVKELLDAQNAFMVANDKWLTLSGNRSE